MGNIPLVKSEHGPLTGGLSVSATPEQFGAGIGQATQQLGGAIQQFGTAIGSYAKEAQSQADTLDVANATSNWNYQADYLDQTLTASPDGSDLVENVSTDYDQKVDDYIAGMKGSEKAKADARADLLRRKNAFISEAAVEAYNRRLGISTQTSVDGLNEQRNAVLMNPNQYDEALTQSLKVLHAQPGMTPEAIAKGERDVRNKLATDYFSAKVRAADEPLDFDAIEHELATNPRFAKDLDPDTTEKILNAVQSARDTAQKSVSAGIQTKITAMKERANKLNPKDTTFQQDLISIQQEVELYGTEKDKADFLKITVGRERFQEAIPASPEANEKRRQQLTSKAVYGELDPQYKPQPLAGGGAAATPYQMAGLQPHVVQGAWHAGQLLGRPFIISSGFRGYPVDARTGAVLPGWRAGAITYNEYIRRHGNTGAAKHSDHLTGDAIDYDVKNWDAHTRGQAIIALRSSGFNYFKFYNDGHVHASMRSGGGVAASDTGLATPDERAALGVTVNSNVPPMSRQPGGRMSRVPTNIQPLFQGVGQKYGVPAQILAAMWLRESGGKLHPGNSPAGAQGPMQFMPATAARFGLKDPENMEAAVDAAGQYIQWLQGHYNGDLRLAVAAYNWGEGNVDAWQRGEKQMPKETSDYLAFVFGPGNEQGMVAAGSPGFGVSNTVQIDAINEAEIVQQKAVNDNVADFLTDASSMLPNSIPQLSDLTDAASYGTRAQVIAQAADTYNADPEKVKVFRTQEEIEIKKVFETGSLEQKLDQMAKIEEMQPDMRKRAYAQLGQTNKDIQTAGRKYSERGVMVARDVLTGEQLMKSDTTKSAITTAQGYTTGESMVQEFWNRAGGRIQEQGADVVDAEANAAINIMASRYGARKWTPEEWDDAVAASLGFSVESIKDPSVPLLLEGVSVEDYQTIANQAEPTDIAALSANGAAPVDDNGTLLTEEIWTDESTIVPLDNNGSYGVVLANGKRVASAKRDVSGNFEPFILDLTPGKVQHAVGAIHLREEQARLADEAAATKDRNEATTANAPEPEPPPAPENVPKTMEERQKWRGDRAASAAQLKEDQRANWIRDKDQLVDVYRKSLAESGFGGKAADAMVEDFIASEEAKLK